jgi:predicted N-acetyltransferase YhbS
LGILIVREIRSARADDAEAVATVVAEAFGEKRRAANLEHTLAAVRQAPDEWRVVEEDGRVVSACHIGIHSLRVGRCAINKGDVGHVATLPECQGRGLASDLMRDTVRYLRESHCQIGRLGGLVAFYSRFGWVPFPRRYLEFPLRSTHAGVRTMLPSEYLLPPAGFEGRVVPYDPVAHHRARVKLHGGFYGARTGSVVVTFGDPPAPGTASPDPQALKFACEVEGELVGYLFAWEREDDVTEFEAKVEIGECAYDLDRPEALGALMVPLLREAHARGAKRVTARFPFDDRVIAALRQAGVLFQCVELHSGPASNMIRIVDVRELFRRIAPELEARLAASPFTKWRGEIALCLPDGDSAVLEIKDGSVGVWDWTPGTFRVDLDQAALLSLVLGLRSFGECAAVRTTDDPREAHAVCEALFPRQPTASGAWG